MPTNSLGYRNNPEAGVSPGLPALFYRQILARPVKEPPNFGAKGPTLGFGNVIQAVITMKTTKKTTGTKTGGWNAA